MSRSLLFSLALVAFVPFASATTPAQAELAGLPNVAFPSAHRVASGRLQASDIPALQRAGVREVIDLSVDNETPDFDEAAAMRAAGIDYRNLPIHGGADLTPATVTRFDQLLNDAGDGTTLVHCASSNRVGALIALRAALIGGQTTEDAVAEGHRWGLKSLEPVVRERLKAWKSAATASPPAG
ncbi:MAG: sulfur transferase domain-containing protein [Burkholderiaceae bacterium]